MKGIIEILAKFYGGVLRGPNKNQKCFILRNSYSLFRNTFHRKLLQFLDLFRIISLVQRHKVWIPFHKYILFWITFLFQQTFRHIGDPRETNPESIENVAPVETVTLSISVPQLQGNEMVYWRDERVFFIDKSWTFFLTSVSKRSNNDAPLIILLFSIWSTKIVP